MKGDITFRIPDGFKAEAQAYADGIGLPLNALLAVALREYLDRRSRQGVSAGPDTAAPGLVHSSTTGKPDQQSQQPASKEPAERTFIGPKLGANQPCYCKSGKRFKDCHGRAKP